jgi:ATP-dependent Clp protease ATP-binding subunit ClpA
VGGQSGRHAAGLAEALRPDLLKAFKPALLGRITIVPYHPLTDEGIRQIIHGQLKRISDRMKENHRAMFSYDAEAVVATIAGRCKEVESGVQCRSHPDRYAAGRDFPGAPAPAGRGQDGGADARGC